MYCMGIDFNRFSPRHATPIEPTVPDTAEPERGITIGTPAQVHDQLSDPLSDLQDPILEWIDNNFDPLAETLESSLNSNPKNRNDLAENFSENDVQSAAIIDLWRNQDIRHGTSEYYLQQGARYIGYLSTNVQKAIEKEVVTGNPYDFVAAGSKMILKAMLLTQAKPEKLERLKSLASEMPQIQTIMDFLEPKLQEISKTKED